MAMVPTSPSTAASLTASMPATANPFLWAHHHITHFEGGKAHQWMCASPHIPLLVAAGYFLLVHAGPRVLSRLLGGKPVPGLSPIVAIFVLQRRLHNRLLLLHAVLVSCLDHDEQRTPGTRVEEGPHNRRVGPAPPPHVRGGLFTSLCYWNRNIFEDGATAFWLLTFNLSKIPELMDTVLLLLKRKPIPFIHWYHHISVMLFCWHAHVSGISNGLGFAVMNMGGALHHVLLLRCALREVCSGTTTC
ncbi:LOW QUALITY PROTEIN: putative GNS1/SUR4 family [Leishmania shawi]|uniref:Elongation of fatty acids protein n=1 Tax=Leishmania shawi TaxID=5680 RepID=A0AAW3C2Y8_9TRYP